MLGGVALRSSRALTSRAASLASRAAASLCIAAASLPPLNTTRLPYRGVLLDFTVEEPPPDFAERLAPSMERWQAEGLKEDSRAPRCHCEAPTLSDPVPARGPRGLPVAGAARPQSRARMRPREASTRGSTRRVDRPRPRGRRPPGARAWVGAARQVRRGTAARAMGLRGRG